MDNRPSATELKPTHHQKLIQEVASICTCPTCEEGRWIKRLANLLPDVEQRELLGWYNAIIDGRERTAMVRADLLERARFFVETLEGND